MAKELLTEYFPLNSMDKVVNIVEHLVLDKPKSCLPILSMVLGWYEHKLVITGKDKLLPNEEIFPSLDWTTFSSTFLKYQKCLEKFKLAQFEESKNEKLAIKDVADFVWKELKNTFYKDKHHIQSLYSFLFGEFSFYFYYHWE